MLRSSIFIAIVFGIVFSLNAQVKDSTQKLYVQFSGFTLDANTYEPIPYIILYNKNLKRSALSDAYGFFSFVAAAGDTILFRSITYKQVEFVIPKNVTDAIFTHFQEMEPDIRLLDEALITPYGTKEALAYAFVYEDIPDDDILRAHKNFESMRFLARTATIVDAELNYRWAMQEHINKTYYSGQLPPNNLLNPFAWAAFFKMLKNGDFKIQP